MTAPLAPWLLAHMGHPVVQNPGVSGIGEDDLLDAEFASDYVEGLQLGLDQVGAINRAQQKRGQRRLNFCRMLRPPGVPLPGVSGLGEDYDDEFEGDDADDIQDDEEIEALGEDDEEVYGADGEEEIGGTIERLERKISRLEAKKAKVEGKLARARRPGKRRRLQKRINRIDRKIEKKRAKLEAKRAKLARKLGVSPAVLAAAAGGAGMAAGAAAMGLSRSQVKAAEEAINQGDVRKAEGILGTVRGLPEEGEIVPIAFQSGGSNVLVGTIGAGGAGLSTVALSMQTPSISYATFRVMGFWAELQVQSGNASDELVTCLATSLLVSGGLNCFYGTQSIAASGVLAGRHDSGGWQRNSGTVITSLRDNPILHRTDTATFAGVFRQEIANVAAINFTFQCALLCKRISDPHAERF